MTHKKARTPVFLTSWFFFLLLAACGMRQKTVGVTRAQIGPAIATLLDSILQEGLDNEALYTLVGRIKPISSVASFSYPLANTDTAAKRLAEIVDSVADKPHLDSLQRIQQALNALEIPDVKLVLSPYKATYSGNRIMQVTAVRISLLDSVLKAQACFFAQFGLVPGADPAVVINTIEYEDRYERLRGYGYLFGYPPYAVDFFVEAFHRSDTSGKNVVRDFFQIPVHTHDNGHFVYAIPHGHRPTADIDSALYHRAEAVLQAYRAIRPKYLNRDSTLRATQFLYDLFNH